MKKVVIFMLILALVLILTPSIIFAEKIGPAEKATGEVELVPFGGSGGWSRYAEFNAHEAKANRPAKGIFSWTQTDGTTTKFHKVVIDTVDVDGDEAEFSGIAVISTSTTAGISTSTTRQGLRLFVKVLDDSPDILWLYWEDQVDYYGYNITNGDIVVHTY